MNFLAYLPQLIAILLFIGGFPGAYLLYQSTSNPWLALILLALYETVVVVGGFIFKVWQKLEPKLVDDLSDKIQLAFSGYRKTYLEYIVFQNRVFDVKGFTTQGPYNLELEKVFVQLSVDPSAPHEVSGNPLTALPEELRTGKHSVWEYVNAKGSAARSFAILGAPGSGKTTLLRHIALTLGQEAARRKQNAPNLLPILLFLRDHGKAIADDPQVTLETLIAHHLQMRQVPLPPDSWLKSQLQAGHCLIMFDGYDEVAEADTRRKVGAWVERCLAAHGHNRFILTSRPHGYRSAPLNGVSVMQVRPLSYAQVKQFVDNWYLANEVMSSQKDDRGVRIAAETGAADLLKRMDSTPTLSELAVNPLLLTMIATVHRYRSSLPGRRVELYAEICEVFLGKRRAAVGLEDELTPAQKIRVLRELAYAMMVAQKREIEKDAAASIVAPALSKVNPKLKPPDFLQLVETGSGLLGEHERGVYSFSHLTFQEYLAAVHILDTPKKHGQLLEHVDSPWWHETIRLYCAQTDASDILTACLDADSVTALSLAIECQAEAREVSAEVRQRYERVMQEGAEHADLTRRALVAKALLAKRIR